MHNKTVRNYSLVIVFVIIIVEVLSFVAARILLSTGLLVEPQDQSGTFTHDYEAYLELRDPIVGWPSPRLFGTGEYDIKGSRISPQFPDPSTDACVSLFGDSFTWGAEVAPEDSYGNVLSQLLGCRVANYGVGGYGTDQAAIRYMNVIADDAPVVVLGHFSEDIIRNVNQLRDFIAGGRFGFKPRFILRSEVLEMVPLPNLSAAEYGSVVTRSRELLPYEYFAPGRLHAPAVMSFPYTKAIATALFHYRLLSALQGIRPTYSPFYAFDHPSSALKITFRTIEKVDKVSKSRNQKLIVLLIPDLHDLKALKSGLTPSYEPLKSMLGAAGIVTIDAADYFLKNFHHDDFCDLFVTCGSSHFNPIGYRMLADSVNAKIVELRLPVQIKGGLNNTSRSVN
jgi:hypothetical protein